MISHEEGANQSLIEYLCELMHAHMQVVGMATQADCSECQLKQLYHYPHKEPSTSIPRQTEVTTQVA